MHRFYTDPLQKAPVLRVRQNKDPSLNLDANLSNLNALLHESHTPAHPAVQRCASEQVVLSPGTHLEVLTGI